MNRDSARWSVIVAPILLTGCVWGSGNAVFNGPVTIQKVFGACAFAKSGLAGESTSATDAGGSGDPTPDINLTTAAQFAGGLTAKDECDNRTDTDDDTDDAAE